MSLDVYLYYPPTREKTSLEKACELLNANGFTKESLWLSDQRDVEATDEVFSSNITHNLNVMADAAGIYKHLWRPEDLGITRARELIEPLRAGLALMKSDRPHFEKRNASNGWGTYEQFVPWIESYLSACEQYPDARIEVSR